MECGLKGHTRSRPIVLALDPQISIVPREDGRYQVGLDDEAPSFETRKFAEAIAARQSVRAKAVRG